MPQIEHQVTQKYFLKVPQVPNFILADDQTRTVRDGEVPPEVKFSLKELPNEVLVALADMWREKLLERKAEMIRDAHPQQG